MGRAIFGLIIFTLFLFGCTGKDIYYFDQTSSGSATYSGIAPIIVDDQNKISISSIVTKLTQGTNITLSCTGSDSNNICTINSTASASSAVTGVYAGIGIDVNANTGDVKASLDSDINRQYVSQFDLNKETVSKIIAGTNVTISPTSGIGEVTINSTASGGADGNCDNNASCTITGKINTALDTNFTGTDNNFTKALDANVIFTTKVNFRGDNNPSMYDDPVDGWTFDAGAAGSNANFKNFDYVSPFLDLGGTLGDIPNSKRWLSLYARDLNVNVGMFADGYICDGLTGNCYKISDLNFTDGSGSGGNSYQAGGNLILVAADGNKFYFNDENWTGNVHTYSAIQNFVNVYQNASGSRTSLFQEGMEVVRTDANSATYFGDIQGIGVDAVIRANGADKIEAGANDVNISVTANTKDINSSGKTTTLDLNALRDVIITKGAGVLFTNSGSSQTTANANLLTFIHPSAAEDTQIGYESATVFGLNVRSGGTRDLNIHNSSTGLVNVYMDGKLTMQGTTDINGTLYTFPNEVGSKIWFMGSSNSTGYSIGAAANALRMLAPTTITFGTSAAQSNITFETSTGNMIADDGNFDKLYSDAANDYFVRSGSLDKNRFHYFGSADWGESSYSGYNMYYFGSATEIGLPSSWRYGVDGSFAGHWLFRGDLGTLYYRVAPEGSATAEGTAPTDWATPLTITRTGIDVNRNISATGTITDTNTGIAFNASQGGDLNAADGNFTGQLGVGGHAYVGQNVYVYGGNIISDDTQLNISTNLSTSSFLRLNGNIDIVKGATSGIIRTGFNTIILENALTTSGTGAIEFDFSSINPTTRIIKFFRNTPAVPDRNGTFMKFYKSNTSTEGFSYDANNMDVNFGRDLNVGRNTNIDGNFNARQDVNANSMVWSIDLTPQQAKIGHITGNPCLLDGSQPIYYALCQSGANMDYTFLVPRTYSPVQQVRLVQNWGMQSSTTGIIDFNVSIGCISGGDAQDTNTYSPDLNNNISGGAVPATVGYMKTTIGVLTNVDGMQPYDTCTMRIHRTGTTSNGYMKLNALRLEASR